MAKHYFLVDTNKKQKRQKYIRRMQVCDFLSRIYLFNTSIEWKNLKDNNFFWQFSVFTPVKDEIKKTTKKAIKWYIKNKISIQSTIWNGSFLRGIAQSGKFKKDRFLSLQCYFRKRLRYIIGICPFKGTIADYGDHKGMVWKNVAALHLDYDEKSYSFMAGVFSMGQEFKDKDGSVYARYSSKCRKWFDKWGIPIEGIEPKTRNCLISPFWPSLFHNWMPPLLRTWRRIPNAKNANLYAGILFRIYTGKQVKLGLIPYLSGEDKYIRAKQILRLKNVPNLWMQYRLTGLDNRIGNIIRDRELL